MGRGLLQLPIDFRNVHISPLIAYLEHVKVLLQNLWKQ